jgi:hypothetical protein
MATQTRFLTARVRRHTSLPELGHLDYHLASVRAKGTNLRFQRKTTATDEPLAPRYDASPIISDRSHATFSNAICDSDLSDRPNPFRGNTIGGASVSHANALMFNSFRPSAPFFLSGKHTTSSDGPKSNTIDYGTSLTSTQEENPTDSVTPILLPDPALMSHGYYRNAQSLQRHPSLLKLDATHAPIETRLGMLHKASVHEEIRDSPFAEQVMGPQDESDQVPLVDERSVFKRVCWKKTKNELSAAAHQDWEDRRPTPPLPRRSTPPLPDQLLPTKSTKQSNFLLWKTSCQA